MPRLLAIDYGKKRCGIAVTDPLQIIATALETIPTEKIFSFLKDYYRKEDIEGFVIGLPLHRDGSEMGITKYVRQFSEKLRSIFPDVKIHFEDERYTSKLAASAMVEANFKKKERQKKENLDMISAVLILQSFMEKSEK